MISCNSPSNLTSAHISVHVASSRRGCLPCQIEPLLAYTSATSALPTPVRPMKHHQVQPRAGRERVDTRKGETTPVSKVSFFVPQAREEGSLLPLYLHLPTSLSSYFSYVEG